MAPFVKVSGSPIGPGGGQAAGCRKFELYSAEEVQRLPVAVIEELVGIDLPDEQVEKLIDGIKANLKPDDIGEKLGGFGKLFG